VDYAGFYAHFFRVNPQRNVGGGDEGVAGHQKHRFACFGGLEDNFAAVFFEVSARDKLDFFAALRLEAIHVEVGHAAGVGFHKHGVCGLGFF
jgi:hypothetical protein